MTVSTTRNQKAKKGNIRSLLKELRISLKDIEARSGELGDRNGKPYHYNTILSAFDKQHKYWNKDLIRLAERMIEEKEKEKQAVANN